ncbi:MAG: hypothetical protein HYV54_01640 [Parcubacteria group bacterium]|nr:hypothetical protein [Parcubacteria group bacterium]
MKASKVEAQPGVVSVTVEAAVVAEVENGKVYEVIRTPGGLMVCPLADITNTNRWRKIESLKSFVAQLHDDKFFRVHVAMEPNAERPNLNRCIYGKGCFNESGFDMVFTETGYIRLPEPIVPKK